MKLERLMFAKVVAHCCSNGLSSGDWEIEKLDQLIEFDVPAPKEGVVSCESVDKLLQLMHEGDRKIEAIKTYRTLTGAGLKESKDAVEKYWTAKPLPKPVKAPDYEATFGDILGYAIKHAPDED